MPRDNYIMLVGHNYDGHRLDFLAYAKERARQVINRTKKGQDVYVQIMDVGTGLTSYISVAWQDGRSTTKIGHPKTHEPVTRNAYDRNGAFKPNQPRIMSITDLYATARKIGEVEPATLVEVSIFSHAFQEGPILVNSDDHLRSDSTMGTIIRDPNDKDGRAGKDFDVMQASELAFFRSAFSPHGLVWIWGCNFNWEAAEMHKLLSVARRQQPNNLAGGMIELTGLTSEQIKIIERLNGYLNVNVAELRRKHRCTFESAKLKPAVAALIRGSYPYKVSSVAKIRAVGALPATYSVKRSMADPLQLLHIAPETRKNSAYYSKSFGIKFDDENRGYAVFEPGFSID